MPHVSTSLFFSRADCASGASAVLRATLHSPWSLVVFFFARPKRLPLEQKAVVFFSSACLPALLIFGNEGATPRTAPRLTWARELWFSPNWITSTFSSWIWRVSDSPSASSVPLKRCASLRLAPSQLLYRYFFRIGSAGLSQPGECKELKCAVMCTSLAQHCVRHHFG